MKVLKSKQRDKKKNPNKWLNNKVCKKRTKSKLWIKEKNNKEMKKNVNKVRTKQKVKR